MSVADDNPHRRNLTVTSFLFILYYWAGGRMIDASLKLPMVSVEIQRPYVAGYMAWAVLLFFAWRYWLKIQSKHWHFRSDSMTLSKNNRFIRRKTVKLIPGEHSYTYKREVGGVAPDVADWGGWFGKMELIVYHITEIRTDQPHGRSLVTGSDSASPVKVSLSRLESIIGRCQLRLAAALKRESFSDIVIPYLLFLVALISGLYCWAIDLDWLGWLGKASL